MNANLIAISPLSADFGRSTPNSVFHQNPQFASEVN